MIGALLCVVLCAVADGPTAEAIAQASTGDRVQLIEAKLAQDRQTLSLAQDETARATAALTLAHDLLTLSWSQSLAAERVLLGTANQDERARTGALAGEVLDVVEPLLLSGSHQRALLPYRAAALTLLAALQDVTPNDAQAAWQGIDLRRQGARMVRLAGWSADHAGDLRGGSDRYTMVHRLGVTSETWLAQLNKRRALGQGQWPAAEYPWQIMLLAEARSASVDDVAASEALLADALPRLVRAGWDADEAAALLVDRMALFPAHRDLPFAGTSLARAAHAAAMVTRGDIDAWHDAPFDSAAGPWARVAARRAARILEARGDIPQAMAAWSGAGLAGDDAAARHAAAWLLGLRGDTDDGGVIGMLSAHALPEVARTARGVGLLRAGQTAQAIETWVKVPPGTRLQAGALAAAAARLQLVDLEQIASAVQRLRGAAMAASTDQDDPQRAQLASRAAGWTLAALIDHALEQDRVDEAKRMLNTDPARAYLDRSDALRLSAKVDLRSGDATDAMALLASHDLALARQLLVARATAVIGRRRGLAPQPAPVDPRGLRAVLPLMRAWLDLDEPHHQLLVADAMRLLGRGEVRRYRAMLQSQPGLADAMLGLAELLAVESDDEQRSEAMSLFRTLTHASLDANPDRWWLSQLRMLQLAADAGRPEGELQARLARLRHASPKLGGVQWARAIESAAQSGN